MRNEVRHASSMRGEPRRFEAGLYTVPFLQFRHLTWEFVMAHRMSLSVRMDRARDNSAKSRTVNGALKRKENANRDKRMKQLIKAGSPPYSPAVMSWASEKLNKRSAGITAEEYKSLVK